MFYLIAFFSLGCAFVWFFDQTENFQERTLKLFGVGLLGVVAFWSAPELLGNNRVHSVPVGQGGEWQLDDWLSEGTLYTYLSETPVDDAKIVLVREKGTKRVFAIRATLVFPQGDFVLIDNRPVAVQ